MTTRWIFTPGLLAWVRSSSAMLTTCHFYLGTRVILRCEVSTYLTAQETHLQMGWATTSVSSVDFARQDPPWAFFSVLKSTSWNSSGAGRLLVGKGHGPHQMPRLSCTFRSLCSPLSKK